MSLHSWAGAVSIRVFAYAEFGLSLRLLGRCGVYIKGSGLKLQGPVLGLCLKVSKPQFNTCRLSGQRLVFLAVRLCLAKPEAVALNTLNARH